MPAPASICAMRAAIRASRLRLASAGRMADGVRRRACAAVRLRVRRQGADRRVDRGGGGECSSDGSRATPRSYRGGFASRAERVPLARAPPVNGGRKCGSIPRARGTRRRCIASTISTPGDTVPGPAAPDRAASDDRGRAWLARRNHRGARARAHPRTPPPPASLALGAACRDLHRCTEDNDPVLLEVFANLFMAIAEEMGVTLQNTASSREHQGAARFFLRHFRCRRRACRQCAAHAGASGIDGRLRHRGDGEAPHHAAGRRVRHQRAL